MEEYIGLIIFFIVTQSITTGCCITIFLINLFGIKRDS